MDYLNRHVDQFAAAVEKGPLQTNVIQIRNMCSNIDY